MLKLEKIDLATDPDAARYIKTEIVTVVFARQTGELVSLEGPNRYQAGDALITGSTGSRWSVSRHRFDAKYGAVAAALAGHDGRYAARPSPVLAKQIAAPAWRLKQASHADAEPMPGTGGWLSPAPPQPRY